jgi:ATP adenylyltransferase C-terminal domain
MASLGVVQAPCHGASRADSADQPRDLSAAGHALGISTSNEGTGYRTALQGQEQEQEQEPTPSMNIQATQFEEDQPYCQAYNLILTGRWIMAVPRSKARFDSDVAVNGLGNLTSRPLISSPLSPISSLEQNESSC